MLSSTSFAKEGVKSVMPNTDCAVTAIQLHSNELSLRSGYHANYKPKSKNKKKKLVLK